MNILQGDWPRLEAREIALAAEQISLNRPFDSWRLEQPSSRGRHCGADD